MQHKKNLSLNIAITLIVISLIFLQGCSKETSKNFIIQFDSNKKVSGKKFALHDISKGLPIDWDGYNYVVLEMKSTTSQRFQVGFTTSDGYNEIRVMSYVPNGWIKLAIPLRFYTQLPDAASDIAGTMNQPRYTGWVNLGGRRSPLQGVDSIGIRMHKPINNPVIELRSISLSVNDLGDEYLGDIPVVDEFGQWNLGDFEGKVKSMDQLKKEWASEDKALSKPSEINYSKYGGYLHSKVNGTGFFRTAKQEGRWWFIDPEGHLFLSLGVDCIGPGGGGNANHLDKRPNFYKELPPEKLGLNSKWRPNSTSIGRWNLYRRFGENYRSKANEMIIDRMDAWGVNSIANWSSRDVINMNEKAFMLQLSRLGIDEGVMGLPDVYANDFNQKIDEVCRKFTEPYKDNPWLIGYFTGNEPSWLGQESRLCDLIMAEEDERPIKVALKEYLAESDSEDRRKEFIFNTFRTFLETVGNAVKRHDPNHLSLGIRFGHLPEDEILEICKDVFDVFSFNSYAVAPSVKTMDRIMEVADMPMIIGEYHFGTVDRGMAQALIQVDNQKERGVAYKYYTEQAFGHPGLIGVGYFQWADQDLTGRGYDGENYNCGLVDVTDRPYPYMISSIKETAKRIYDVHVTKIKPTSQKPLNPCGYGLIPDMWN